MSRSHSLVYQIALALILSLSSLGIGYELGLFTAARSRSKSQLPVPTQDGSLPEKAEVQEADSDDKEDEESAEDIPDGDLATISAGFLEPCKMVLVVRTDLKLTPGTVAAQLSDQSKRSVVDVTLIVHDKTIIQMRACDNILLQSALQGKSQAAESLGIYWVPLITHQAKIALKAKSEEQLLELEAIAKSLNLCARSVQDPELGHSVRTVLAIGPAPVDLVNEVTGKLRLL
ncbi:peptidyl-tRNA hydrolase II [Pholiota conissans]|uniref:peptidyl-tRNA hydrolase n=1 Tax=Pholiota conissans TaxID=109636 RepID=A0A9P5Z4E5_9AGAR|nr:peptidyl-tRNA hydrolase II [Pholiota conissans]